MAGTPGACSQVFCHPIRCISCMGMEKHTHATISPVPQPPHSVAILAQVGDNHAGFPRLGFSVIATSLKGEHFSVLLSVVCQSWFGMAFSTGNSLTGVFQQAPSSLEGHNNSAELSSILGRDSFAALFLVSENTSFLTRLFVVNFGVVVLVTVHWNTMVCLSYCLSVTSPSKFLLGVLSVDGFDAIAVAMLTLATFVCFQWIWWWAVAMLTLATFVCFQWIWWWADPVYVMLPVATLGLRHIWLLLFVLLVTWRTILSLFRVFGFPRFWVWVLLIFRALGCSTQLSGEGLLKSKGQSSTNGLSWKREEKCSILPTGRPGFLLRWHGGQQQPRKWLPSC